MSIWISLDVRSGFPSQDESLFLLMYASSPACDEFPRPFECNTC